MYEKIYEPNDDTYFFVDTLKKEHKTLNNIQNPIFSEVGCGNLYISKYLMNEYPGSFVISQDINQYISEFLKNLEKKFAFNVIRSDLLTNIEQKFIDVIVFNPPYVPSEEEETKHYDIRASYAGGNKGRKIIDRFIENLLDVKLVYLLVIEINKPVEVIELFTKKGYEAKIINSKKIPGETLHIIKAKKKD